MDKNNFEILSGNIVVAIWKNGNLTVENESLLPLYLKRVKNAELWLETRAIDSHRANSRLLKKALRLAEKDDVSTVIHVNGATITDNYWIRPIGSDLTYDDVKFTDDYFARLALKGTYSTFNKVANRVANTKNKTPNNPELTNVGSFEKCWTLRDGRWWMYKKATHDEIFSELFVYELGDALGMNMAVYERGDKCIKSIDFADGASQNFEPASSFMGDNEDYADVVKALSEICSNAIPDYIRLIFMDTICANPDRHTNNFGVIRDIESGEIIGLAPNYDNNMALISRGYPSKPKSGDIMISLFNDLMQEYPEYRKYIPELTEDIVRKTIAKIGMRVKTQAIVDVVMGRYELIQK